MRYLFQTTIFLHGIPVGYKLFIHSNGAYYAESMNPDHDNFLLDYIDGRWKTSLARNLEAAAQIGTILEADRVRDNSQLPTPLVK